MLARLDDDLGAHREAVEKLLDEHVRAALEPAADEPKAKKKKKTKKAEGSADEAQARKAKKRRDPEPKIEADEPVASKDDAAGDDALEDDAPRDDALDMKSERVRTCFSCDTSNDLDATFCKRCATRLVTEEDDDARAEADA